MSNPNPLRKYRLSCDPPLTLGRLAACFSPPVNKSTVLRWEEERVPAERVIEVERVTGVPRSELRPDLYPPEPSFAEAAQ